MQHRQSEVLSESLSGHRSTQEQKDTKWQDWQVNFTDEEREAQSNFLTAVYSLQQPDPHARL